MFYDLTADPSRNGMTIVSKDRPLVFVSLHLMDYREALELQHNIVSALKAGFIHHDVILILEHPPVYTVGRSRGLKNLKVSEAFLRRIGIPLIPIERGGDITYHGPGQIVSYPVLDLHRARLGVHEYVSLLEQVMVLTAAEWRIEAGGCSGKRGIWCGDKKLGSIGIRVSRGISSHGFALNVNVSLTPFQWIHPCGLEGVQMTSMQAERGGRLPLDRVRAGIRRHFCDLLGRDAADIDIDALRRRIRR